MTLDQIQSRLAKFQKRYVKLVYVPDPIHPSQVVFSGADELLPDRTQKPDYLTTVVLSNEEFPSRPVRRRGRPRKVS